jgi:hypothetical protein
MKFRPHFTIRDVFWTITLAAVLVAWWMDHHRLIAMFDDYEQRAGIFYYQQVRNQYDKQINALKEQIRTLELSRQSGKN